MNYRSPNERHWHDRWINILNEVSSWSEDLSSKYGAVLVDPGNNHLISTGFNGLPLGSDQTSENMNQPDKYNYFVHAEINCLLNSPVPTPGHVMYLISPPCAGCAGAIVNAGIGVIYFIKPHDTESEKFRENSTGWRASLYDSSQILLNAGVVTIHV